LSRPGYAGNSQRRPREQDQAQVPEVVVEDTDNDESRPLLPKSPPLNKGRRHYHNVVGSVYDASLGRLQTVIKQAQARFRGHSKAIMRSLKDPETWSSNSMKIYGMNTARTFSAVFLGLLLNVLDGLSYGLILFPLGEEIFSQTGPDGISIFFVSCIVSQLVYSGGASIFRGGVGSEMIEVVPFFHKMAYAIIGHMGTSRPKAVLATVIVSYATSSILTGLIFLALGIFKLGSLVSFFPRNILTGCVGGVGFFLFVTGIEVSARLDGNLEYNLVTLQKLFEADTVLLWIVPLVLSILIVTIRHYFHSPLILPAFFIVIVGIFYFVVSGILRLDLDVLRNAGWIFPKPETGVPFYRFYTYFGKLI
jgi:sulfate permease, SulP family